MTLGELEMAVRQALETGRIGIPLWLKVWLQRSGGTAEAAENFARLVALFVPMLQDAPATLLATGPDDGTFLQALLTGRTGRTALIIHSTQPGEASKVQLLMVGNHGILQLSGDPSLADEPLVASPHAAAWRDAFEASRRSGRAVDVSLLRPFGSGAPPAAVSAFSGNS